MVLILILTILKYTDNIHSKIVCVDTAVEIIGPIICDHIEFMDQWIFKLMKQQLKSATVLKHLDMK